MTVCCNGLVCWRFENLAVFITTWLLLVTNHVALRMETTRFSEMSENRPTTTQFHYSKMEKDKMIVIFCDIIISLTLWYLPPLLPCHRMSPTSVHCTKSCVWRQGWHLLLICRFCILYVFLILIYFTASLTSKEKQSLWFVCQCLWHFFQFFVNEFLCFCLVYESCCGIIYCIHSNIRRKLFPDSSSKKWGVVL
jgi:hypothetical protein